MIEENSNSNSLHLTEIAAFHNLLHKYNNVKIVRHIDNRLDSSLNLRDLYIKDPELIYFYQNYQSKDQFSNAEVILTFIGIENSKALFIGAFEVKETSKLPDNYLDSFAPESDEFKIIQGANFIYKMEKLESFRKFENRLIIDWGKSTISWVQWLIKNGKLENNKVISELMPEGFVNNFPGIMEVNLSFKELRNIINNPDAHREWKQQLSSYNGIYMIYDKQTGEQYIGGTYESEIGVGIWGRWLTYARTLDGGNTRLVEIKAAKGEEYILNNFQITLLDLLPKHYHKKLIQARETLFKEKFGTRVHGLNLN